MDTKTTELRVEMPAEELTVLDGYCSATGQSRTTVMRRILLDWSDKKLHEAVLICRVAGVNPTAPEANRGSGA